MSRVFHKKIIVFVLFSILSFSYFSDIASATNDIDITFNVEESINLSVTGDLIITDLQPGLCGASNSATITVGTNNATGYELSATVGGLDSTTGHQYTTTDLTNSDSSIASKFSMLAVGTAQSTIGSGKWGYSIDGGSTYNGLPLYTDTTNTAIIKTSDTYGSDSLSLKIGACAESGKPAGTYGNIINFTAVAKYTTDSSDDSTQNSSSAKQVSYQSTYSNTSSEEETSDDGSTNSYAAPLGANQSVDSNGQISSEYNSSTISNISSLAAIVTSTAAIATGIYVLDKNKE